MSYRIITAQNTLNTSATTSVTTTYGSTATAGNLLIATVFAGGIGLGNAAISGWTNAITSSFLAAADEIDVFYTIAQGTETAITCTCTGASSMVLAIHEFSTGPLQSTQTWLDQTNTNNSGSLGASLTTGSITPTKPKQLLIALMGMPTGGTSAWSWNNGFTLMSSNANLMDGFLVDENISAINPTASWTGTSTAGGGIASFFVGSTGVSGSNFLDRQHFIVGSGMGRSEDAN